MSQYWEAETNVNLNWRTRQGRFISRFLIKSTKFPSPDEIMKPILMNPLDGVGSIPNPEMYMSV
jgi:hypothetical protein